MSQQITQVVSLTTVVAIALGTHLPKSTITLQNYTQKLEAPFHWI
jgi:hypothetical protein